MAEWCPPPPPTAETQDRRQLIGCIAGSLAHLGWRPLLLTGTFRQLLINQFANPDNLDDPALREEPFAAIWQNTLKTGILIETVQRWRGELVEKRPAVLLNRNAYQNLRVVIDDRVGADQRGFENYTTLWVGSHTLFCIHGTGASCEILATMVQRNLTEFAPAIRQQLNLMSLRVVEVGTVSEVEEATQNYVVPITIGWAYQESWSLKPDALPLRAVDVTITIEDL